MTNTLQEHVRHVNEQSSEVFLGRVCWYVIREMRAKKYDMCISHVELVQGLHRHNLQDIADVPPYPRDGDVFKRACTDAQVNRQPVPGFTDIFVSYELVNIAKGVRRIVSETVDSDDKSLDYKQLRDVIFDPDTKKITFAPANDYHDDRSMANAISDDIVRTFNDQQGMLTSWAVREFVRKLLLKQRATCLRSGVYFLAEKNAEHVEAVESFVNGLPGQVGEFVSLPLIDTEKQRNNVKKAFEAETAGAVDKLTLEIGKIKADDEKLSMARYQAMLATYAELYEKTSSYGDVLEQTLEETHIRLAMLQANVLELADRTLGDD